MNIEHACCKTLVSKFIENPNWPREIKIAKKLLYMCPDLDSWLQLNLPTKINSLMFFLTENGKIYIPSSQSNPYLLDMEKLKPKSKNKLEISII